jgi:hypothetical protein
MALVMLKVIMVLNSRFAIILSGEINLSFIADSMALITRPITMPITAKSKLVLK